MDKVLQQIVKLIDQHDDIEVAWLYGSQAKGTQHVDSDYDVALALKRFCHRL